MIFNCEVTDTFAGEANYCWVRRAQIEAPHDATQAAIMRKAKAALGLAGVRGRTTTMMGEGYEFRPHGVCQIAFVYPEY